PDRPITPPAVARRTRAAPVRARTGPSASATELMATAPPRGRRLPWLLGGGAAMLAAGGLALLLTRTTTTARPATAAHALDAGVEGGAERPPSGRARLVIESVPSGATGTVAGLAFGPTPGSIDVPAGTVDLHLELPGRPPCIDRVTVAASETLRTKCAFAEAWARLVVDSHPAGATVLIDGKRVGVTPLTLTELAAHPRAGITLEHADYLPATGIVDLVAGADVRFERTLRAAPPVMGKIKLFVEDGWAWVFLKGKKVGRAPNGALPLPVGRQRLKLQDYNGREWFLDVDVSPTEVHQYTTKLPS
ncbi:MAG: PEGA domain-containing protein, partial [Rhodoglobus sp.]